MKDRITNEVARAARSSLSTAKQAIVAQQRITALMSGIFALLLAAVAYTSFAPATATPAAAQSSCPQWKIAPAPNVPNQVNVLDALSASSASDIWAVGYSYDPNTSDSLARNLAQHWDGKEWKIVSTPNPGPDNNYLDGVLTFAPNNAWAVGDAGNNKVLRNILLHWDGSAWTTVVAPVPADAQTALYAIDGVAPNDIWAVGLKLTYAAGAEALIFHYDGNNWSNLPTSLENGRFSILYNVIAHAADDVWAVGTQPSRGNSIRDLQLHWDGKQWQDLAEPQAQGGGVSMERVYDLAVAGPGNARFLVGIAGRQPAIVHIDGDKKEATGAGFRVADYNVLTGLVALSRTEAWAVGYGVPGGQSAKNGQHRLPLVLHTTNGSDWFGERTAPIEGNSSLLDIIVVPGTQDLLAVGSANGNALIETYSNPCAAPPPTPTTPSAPTPVQATATAKAAPTFPPTPIPGENETSRAFPETGKSVKGIFLDYWDSNGGLTQQGYPISEEFTEISPLNGKAYTVQYFERAVFEYHPENQPPHNVLLSQLGTFQYKRKYGATGAPSQQPNNTEGSQLFTETGHKLGGKFLEYWRQHGGLAQQGYPISDEFQEKSALDGKTYLVQYFERAVFELHSENQPPFDVLLSQLGTFQHKLKYP